MKAFVQPPAHISRAMFRVSDALARFAPGRIEVVSHEPDADLVVLHTIGYLDILGKIRELETQKKRYAIIQYCLISTGYGVADWLPLWEGAAAVWSYYRLPLEYYFAPMGADSRAFHPIPNVPRNRSILTSGYVMETETVLEAVEASHRVGMHQVHLGPLASCPKHVTAIHNVSDFELACAYSSCQFVAGLRRVEGFEMPAAEGVLCGARPIMYDKPHYRDWFDGLATFIPERSEALVANDLQRLFQEGATPVSDLEREDAAYRFDWQRIITGFWERI